MLKKVFKYLLLAILLVALYFAYGTYRKLTIISGYSSKYICSCVFGSDRKVEDILALDLAFSPITWAKHDVDYENKKVTSTVFGMKPNTAIYRDGFGCSLLANFPEERLRKQSFPKTQTTDNSQLTWPLGNQISLSEEETKLNERFLAAIAPEFIEEDSSLLKNTTAITITYDGKLITEKYRAGFDKSTPVLGWSMTKSITSTLVGILVKEGVLTVDAPAPIPEWKNDERNQISLHHLLQMTSGLDWDENYSRFSPAVSMLYEKGDMYQYAIQPKSKHKAGTKWYYSSGTTNILSGIVRNQFENDQSYWRFPYTSLFNKLGMTSAVIETDASGMFAGSSYGFATARDWTRYGLLYYNQGVWFGDTIISPEWIKYTSSTSKCIPRGCYGAQWWLNLGKDGKRDLENIPTDLFYCKGYQGQRIYVIPSKKLVITRFGKTFKKKAFDDVAFLQRIFDALPK